MHKTFERCFLRPGCDNPKECWPALMITRETANGMNLMFNFVRKKRTHFVPKWKKVGNQEAIFLKKKQGHPHQG